MGMPAGCSMHNIDRHYCSSKPTQCQYRKYVHPDYFAKHATNSFRYMNAKGWSLLQFKYLSNEGLSYSIHIVIELVAHFAK